MQLSSQKDTKSHKKLEDGALFNLSVIQHGDVCEGRDVGYTQHAI